MLVLLFDALLAKRVANESIFLLDENKSKLITLNKS
jgi:hypothetical protein